jgi:hypothetical protein
MGRSKSQSQEKGRPESVSWEYTRTRNMQLIVSGSYKSGVKPLGLKSEIRHAIKNLSDDLPPISDIEQMFDHLVSRVCSWNFLSKRQADQAGPRRGQDRRTSEWQEAKGRYYVLVSSCSED